MWARDGYAISTDRAHLDRDLIWRFLHDEAYWSKGIPRDLFERSVERSLNFGVYEGQAGHTQVGYCRVVTDDATFAWLCDVFVLPAYRGRGLGAWLIATVVAHPDLHAARLRARDARRARSLREVRVAVRRGRSVHAHRAPPVSGRCAVSSACDLLRSEMVEAYDLLHQRIEGLQDPEFWWQPVADCWTIRQDPTGHWAADYPEPPHPDPAPFTTIAWRLVHVAECKLMYHEYAFGAAQLTWPEIEAAHTARDAIAALEHGQALLLADLTSLRDADLDAERRTNWGEAWPAWRIFTTMIRHDLQHGGEIGVLRDLYRVTKGGAVT